MLWPDFLSPLFFVSVGIAVVDAFGAFRPNPNHYSGYNSGASPNYSSGKPTARHKNHCAYVVEKTVSYTVQDGAAPYVKAEYKKCGWGKKCPALKYRMVYKPKYKVEYKTMTELEWRCCPGFSGVGCTNGPYGMKAMPPFKGPAQSYKGMPSQKGPQPPRKGPQPSIKGPMPSYNQPLPSIKGPMPPFRRPMPSYKGFSNKGPMTQPHYNRNHWNQLSTPYNKMGGYPGPNVAQSYPETLYRPYPQPETDPVDPEPDQEPEPEPEQHIPLINEQDSEHEQIPEGQEPFSDYQDPLPAPQQPVPETQAPSGDSELNLDTGENSATIERLNRMEDDVQRLSLGIETLRAKMTSLEDHLRASLREDTNRMISTILSAAPASAAAKPQDSIGFEQLHGGAPDIDSSDAFTQLPNLSELAEKVAELQSILLARSTELSDMKNTILEHDNTLRVLNNGTVNLTDSHQALETMVDTRLSEVETTLFGRFEKRMKSAEERCDGRMTETELQCNRQVMLGQEQLEQVINGSVTALKKELQDFHADLQGLEPEDSCCIAMSGLTERLVLVEHSMDGLNQSQVHLRAELGSHKDHVEGMIEGRLGYVESILTTTEKQPDVLSSRTASNIEFCLEQKINDLENRLFVALEELSNTTSPAFSEGQVVAGLVTEVEALKKRMEEDVDSIQKQFGTLELLCTSSCSPQAVLTGYNAPLLTEEDQNKHDKLNRQLSTQTERLDQLNTTLKSVLTQLATRQDEKKLQDEVTLLKVSINSVNHTLGGLQDTFGKVVQEVGHTNLTWQEREDRIAKQVKGVVQLVGQQASMLGAGERRLTRLKGELQDLRRRLAGELQTCRSTTLGVQKEVNEVGGRVTRIEGQCGGLARLTEDLELVRGELEKHTDGYFSKVNNTLLNHSIQLSELKEGLKNCSEVSGATMSTTFVTTGPPLSEQSTIEPPEPRGDQFMVPKQGRDEQELT